MKIGEIAQQVRVSKSIIRYYEGMGLLPRAIRNPSGYRDYTDSDLARIQLVAGARRLGFSFEDIKEILAMREGANAPSPHILELLTHKMGEVGKEIDRLKGVQLELARLHELAQSHTDRSR